VNLVVNGCGSGTSSVIVYSNVLSVGLVSTGLTHGSISSISKVKVSMTTPPEIITLNV